VLGFTALSEAPLSTLPDAGGATNVTASPGAGSLTLTGYAPTVTAQQSRTASPGVGSLTLTGFAPTVSVGTSATALPGTGALVLTGYAPSVSVPTSVSVTPGTGGLVIRGFEPTVDNGLSSGSKSGGVAEDPYYYKKRKKKQPEPVSKEFGDDWKPPTPRPAIPPLPAAQEIIARQDAAIARTQAQLTSALEQLARQQAEAEQEDEDEAVMLLLAA
jgi:hypothetical protein